MALYAVGDLQGCLSPLQRLLDKVRFDPATDTLWLTGDLVNRGPQSLATLRFVKSLGPSASVVLGNHDLHLLALSCGHARPKRKDTLDEILEAPDREALLDWLRFQPLMRLDTSRQLALVHAGIYPGWALLQARCYAAEVEQVLQSPGYPEFLAAMYGNEPVRWSDDLLGMGRLRFITNAFTRMRICADDWALELSYKQGVADIPAGYRPWFNIYTRLTPGWRILFGHWAALQAETGVPAIVALDSGYIWGNHMTMLRVDDGEVFTVDYRKS